MKSCRRTGWPTAPPVRHLESTGIILEAEEMRHTVGNVVDDPEASMKKATQALAGPSGKTAYNAYRFFPSGNTRRYSGSRR